MNLSDIIFEYKSELIAMLIGCVITVVVITFIISWKRMTWAIKEFVKMYSANTASWFSKKRFEGGSSYMILQCGMVFWLTKCSTVEDFSAWAIIEAGFSGYTVSQIQKEKKMNIDNDNANNADINNPEDKK